MYRLQFLDLAERDFERLDRSNSTRILRKLHWLATNAESITEEGLRGRMAGLSKLREGDFRIVYELIRDEQTIIVHSIGHRNEVYKR